MKVFGGTSNFPLTEKIAKELQLEVSPLEIHVFPDGEKRVRVLPRVVNEDCVVVQSTATPGDTFYMELFFIVDALKRSGARSIIAVIPYLGYQRQDHVFREGEAVSLQVIAKTLEVVGVGRIITFDLHTIKTPEVFKIPIEHLSALSLFAEKIKEILGGTDSVLVSPDMGGVRRIKLLSEMLSGMPHIEVVKNRDLASGEISISDVLGGEVKEKAFIVDDMIATGSTIAKAAEVLAEKGAKEIYVLATHPVFTQDATRILQDAKVEKVFVTDSVDILGDKHFSKLQILTIAPIIAAKIRDII